MAYFDQDTEGFGKQLPINLISNIAMFAINMAVGIWITPFYLANLGVAVYGLIPLVASLTNYVGLLINSLNYTVSRYLTVDLQKRDFSNANITFNTAAFGTAGIILLTAVVVVILAVNISKIFQIPSGQEYETMLLFLGINCAFLIRTWSSNFNVSFFAYNRIDLRNFMEIINRVLQAFLILALFTLITPKLHYVSIAYIVAALLVFGITVVFWRRITPELSLKLRDFNVNRLKEMLKTGAWLIIDSIGALLFLQIDLILVNLLFGSEAGGEYAIVFQWGALLWSVGSLLAGVITPMILIYYAKGKLQEIITLSKTGIKTLGFSMGFLVSLLCGFAPALLSLWVGPEFVKLTPLMWILTGHLALNISLLPLVPINVSYNKVRVPGMVTLVLGIGSVFLAIGLSQIAGWGIYGIAVAGGLMLTLKNAVFNPWYTTQKVMGIPLRTYASPIFACIVTVVITSSVIYLLTLVLSIPSWLHLGFYSAILGIIYGILVWKFGLNRDERTYLHSLIPAPVRRYIPLK